MRRFVFFMLLVFLYWNVSAQSLSPEETKTRLFDIVESYSPSSHKMMTILADLPTVFEINGVRITLSEEQSPLTWISKQTEKGIVESVNTVVHESIHGFTSRYAYAMLKDDERDFSLREDNYSAFYLNVDSIYLVKHSEVFSSNLLKKQIPKDLRTFRYDPYISPKNDHLGSQIQGVYGLMDEWNAYYHGTKAAYDLFEYYKDKSSEDKQVYLRHVSDFAGTLLAYYEFRFFILKYLELAQTDYPEVYDGIVQNREFKNVYSIIDSRFSNLIDKIETRLNTIEDLVTSDSYTSVFRKDGYYFIGSSGVGLFLKERGLLIEELKKPEMVRLHQTLTSGN